MISNARTYLADDLILMLFFLSGTCGLIYEVSWAKMLTWSFGSTVFATSTVLVAFMGGLGLGSLVFGRLVDSHSDRSLEVYAILQAGIGLSAFAIPFLLGSLDRIYDYVYQSFHSSFYLFSLIRFTLSLTILIIPTTLMGGTLPVISRALVRSIGRVGRKVGLLYFVNTVGAVAGAIFAGFFLIERVGLKETTFIAGLLNFVVAGTVMLVSRKLYHRKNIEALAYEQKRGQQVSKDVPTSTGALNIVYLALLIYTLSGFCALGYEVLWTRVLVFFVGSSTYAFTIILATFLLGLALGSLFAARFVEKKNLFFMLGAIEISIGLFGMLSLLIFVRMDNFSTSLYSFFSRLEWWKLTMIRFIQSFLILLVPTFLMGMAFPVVIKICSNSIRRLGRSLGNLYALNTFGAAGGSFVAGFILIPLFGLQQSITVLACLNLTIGLAAVFYSSLRQFLKYVILAGTTSIVAAGIFHLPPHLITRAYEYAEPMAKLVYYKEGITGTITVHDYAEKGRVLNIDGINVAGTNFILQSTQKIQAHLPLLLHPEPKRVLHIGFGSGGTAWSMIQANIESLDTVEISSDVIDASGYFTSVNHNVLTNPKVNLIIDDAKSYILHTRKKYDVVASDAIHPEFAGNGTLYSRDYFELCKGSLKEDGLMSFWLPLYRMSEEDYKTVLRTFSSVFPFVTVWYINSHVNRYTIAIGAKKPFQIDFRKFQDRVNSDRMKKDVEKIHMDDPYKMLSCFMLGPEGVAEYVGAGPINTYNNPVIEFSVPRAFVDSWYVNLANLLRFRESVTSILANIKNSEEEKLTKYLKAVPYLIQGHIANWTRDPHKEIAAYQAALEINPTDKTIPLLVNEAKYNLYTYYGQSYNQMKSYQKAVEAYKAAIEIYPERSRPHAALAIVYCNMGLYDKAIEEGEIAKKIDATYALAYYVLAHAYSQKGLYEKATQNMKMFRRLKLKSRV